MKIKKAIKDILSVNTGKALRESTLRLKVYNRLLDQYPSFPYDTHYAEIFSKAVEDLLENYKIYGFVGANGVTYLSADEDALNSVISQVGRYDISTLSNDDIDDIFNKAKTSIEDDDDPYAEAEDLDDAIDEDAPQDVFEEAEDLNDSDDEVEDSDEEEDDDAEEEDGCPFCDYDDWNDEDDYEDWDDGDDFYWNEDASTSFNLTNSFKVTGIDPGKYTNAMDMPVKKYDDVLYHTLAEVFNVNLGKTNTVEVSAEEYITVLRGLLKYAAESTSYIKEMKSALAALILEHYKADGEVSDSALDFLADQRKQAKEDNNRDDAAFCPNCGKARLCEADIHHIVMDIVGALS